MSFFFSCASFAQPAGLSFYERYLTDDELDSKERVEVTIPDFKNWQHEYLTASGRGKFYLNPVYDYVRPEFVVEEDDTGKQWIHLSVEAIPVRAASNSKFTKTKLWSMQKYPFSEKKRISFSVNLSISHSSDSQDKVNIFTLQGKGTAFNRNVVILVCDKRGFWLDAVDRTLQDIEKNSGYTSHQFITPYTFGETAEVVLEVTQNVVSVEVNGIKNTYKFQNMPFEQYQISVGLDTRISSFFAEAFLSDITVE